MALVKKLQKVGNARGLVLSVEILALMGLEDGDDIVLEMIGDALLIRKAGLERPSTLDIVAAAEMISDTLRLKAEHREKHERVLTDNRQRLLYQLRKYGPCTSAELAEALGLTTGSVNKSLLRLKTAGLVREGDVEWPPVYHLVPEMFEGS